MLAVAAFFPPVESYIYKDEVVLLQNLFDLFVFIIVIVQFNQHYKITMKNKHENVHCFGKFYKGKSLLKNLLIYR